MCWFHNWLRDCGHTEQAYSSQHEILSEMIESCPYVKARPDNHACADKDWVRWQHKKPGKCTMCYDREAEEQLQREEELNRIERETMSRIEEAINKTGSGAFDDGNRRTRGTIADVPYVTENEAGHRKKRGQVKSQPKERASIWTAESFDELMKLPEKEQQAESKHRKDLEEVFSHSWHWFNGANGPPPFEYCFAAETESMAGSRYPIACRWLRWEKIDADHGAWTGNYVHGKTRKRARSTQDSDLNSARGLKRRQEAAVERTAVDLLSSGSPKRVKRCDSGIAWVERQEKGEGLALQSSLS